MSRYVTVGVWSALLLAEFLARVLRGLEVR